MCGIAGFFRRSQLSQPFTDLLRSMILAVDHRGPDDQGFHEDDRIGLAHARLSIIDLSGGHQPMADHDRSLWITFNGEIFNYVELRQELGERGYRFRTHSDTETILACYKVFGLDFVRHLNGDFAFALWDRKLNRLVLVRDRMGVRPLFYTVTKEGLYFASAIKALLAVPEVVAEPDPMGLAQIFTMWCPLAPRTFFKGISELPPAHMLIATPDQITIRAYWQLEFPEAVDEPSEGPGKALAEEMIALLQDATKIRLRSDVPVGSYLSGGLDSSIVTALAERITSSPLTTFSVRFENAEYDESEYQQTIAAALGTDHRSFLCTTADIGCTFPKVMRHVEQPILRTGPAPLFMLSRLVRDSGLKVVLTGEGADEVFGGYDIFKEAKLRRFCARQPESRMRPLLLRRLYPYLPRLQGQSQRYLEAFFGRDTDCLGDPLFSHLPRFHAAPGANIFLSPDLRQQLQGYHPLEELRDRLPTAFNRWHPLAQAQFIEATYLLPGYILSSQGDRMAMGHGVEGRFPFLDHRVVEFGARLPARLKLKRLCEKHILREGFRDMLPASVVNRSKQPYRAPDSQSFTGPQAPPYVRECLSQASIAKAGLFDAGMVQRLSQKADRQGLTGVRDNMAFVGILSAQLVHRDFVENCARKPVPSSTTLRAG